MALTNASASTAGGVANEYVSLSIACNAGIQLSRNFCGTFHPSNSCGRISANGGTLACSSSTGEYFSVTTSLPKGTTISASTGPGMAAGYYFG